MSSPPEIVAQPNDAKVQLIYKNDKCGGSGETIIKFICDPTDQVCHVLIRRTLDI